MPSHDRRAAGRRRAWGRGPIILKLESLEHRALMAANSNSSLPDLVNSALDGFEQRLRLESIGRGRGPGHEPGPVHNDRPAPGRFLCLPRPWHQQVLRFPSARSRSRPVSPLGSRFPTRRRSSSRRRRSPTSAAMAARSTSRPGSIRIESFRRATTATIATSVRPYDSAPIGSRRRNLRIWSGRPWRSHPPIPPGAARSR